MIAKLYLKRGLRPAVGDTDSAEEVKQSINLMEGFWSLRNTQYWRPGLPQHKSGIWADLPIKAGRELQANEVQNVKETIEVQIVTTTIEEMALEIESLMQFIRETRRFWTDEAQIDPPYLEYQATGAEGPQYSRIYEIDAALNEPGESTTGIAHNITLTIEREPGWYPIPPGANPKIFTRFMLGQYEGLDYTWAAHSSSPASDTPDSGYSLQTDPSLIEETIQNRFEPDTSNWDTLNSQNFITVAANDIPGDMPARILLVIDQSAESILENFRFFIAKSTNPISKLLNGINLYQYPYASLLTANNLGHELTVAPATANDTGGLEGYSLISGHLANKSRIEITPDTGAGFEVALAFNAPFRSDLHRGRYALVARMRQDSGSAGDCQVYFTFQQSAGIRLQTNTVNVPLQAGTGNTTRFPLAYLGEIFFPTNQTPAVIDTAGGGVHTRDNSDLQMVMYVSRSTGSALIYFCDLMLIKLDEGAVELVPAVNDLLATSSEMMFYDNTGYFMHGRDMSVARSQDDSSGEFMNPVEIRGGEIKLTPGVDNHLFFFVTDSNGESNVLQQFKVRLHVLPCFSGVRPKMQPEGV